MKRREFMTVVDSSAHEATRQGAGSWTSRSNIRGWSVLALLFATGILWAAPLSAQTERGVEGGVEVSVDPAQPATHRRNRPATQRAYRGSNYAAAGRYWGPAYVAGGTHYGYVGAPYGYWRVGYVYARRGYVRVLPK